MLREFRKLYRDLPTGGRIKLIMLIIICSAILALEFFAMGLNFATMQEKPSESDTSISRVEVNDKINTVPLVPKIIDTQKGSEDMPAAPNLASVCNDIHFYAKNLGSDMSDGIITLSRKEMEVVREFIKDNIEDFSPGKWTTYTINKLGISAIGHCEYDNCDFFIHINRKVVILDKETEKLITITNPLDYDSDGYPEACRVLWGKDGVSSSVPSELYVSFSESYVYREDDEHLPEILIERWEFGNKTYTWTRRKDEASGVWSGGPVVAAWNEDTHFFIMDGNLYCICEGEDDIKLIAKNVTADDAAIEELMKTAWP